MKVIKNTLLYIWQLPQNLFGLILRSFYKADERFGYNDSVVQISRSFRSGISLGRYIILKYNREDAVKHEYGHCRQSKRWGPLYLPVVGLVSLMHNMFCDCSSRKHKSYYNVWPENEADRLGGVERN